jgi:class 3 adenylate cyclase
LADRVRRNNGAVVKTIGDAVMAAFADPADAVRAAIEIQSDTASIKESMNEIGDRHVVIKLGMHQGPAFAVTLNDRLDYFGTTANKAARLSDMSNGGDIVLSQEMASDAAVLEVLAGRRASPCAEHVKGFDAPVHFIRTWPDKAIQDERPPVEATVA